LVEADDSPVEDSSPDELCSTVAFFSTAKGWPSDGRRPETRSFCGRSTSTVANCATVVLSSTGGLTSTAELSATGATLSTAELFSTEVHSAPVAPFSPVVLCSSVAVFCSGAKKRSVSSFRGAGKLTTVDGGVVVGDAGAGVAITASTQSLLISISSRSTAKLILRRGCAVLFAFIRHHLDEVVDHVPVIFRRPCPGIVFPN